MPDQMARLQEALGGRYTLQHELGRGGMATVYLAEDLKHHRPVALKVLKPELASSLGPDRFLREIEISARLTHPHILPLLDSGDADGKLFYVMPYVEGESLRERLDREKQLPVEDALRITREVADALHYAHSHGVIHRDIKPENILLESGHAVVSDFGIARAVTAAGGERLTESGLAVGTPFYMSPEQAGGSQDLDARSDLYSLACVSYEMLVGEPPFTGTNPQAVLARKLFEPVPSLRVVRETVPQAVEAAVLKALGRVPADRYAAVREFAEALAHAAEAERTQASPAAPFEGRLRAGGAQLAHRRAYVVLLAALLTFGGVAVLLLAPWRTGDGRRAGTRAATVGSVPGDTNSLRLGVLLPEVRAGTDSSFGGEQLIQHLLASEFTRHRGVAVVDPLSLNSRLDASASRPNADPLGELRDWGLRYVVRTTVSPGPQGLELTVMLTDTRRGDVVATGRFTSTDEAQLPDQIRRAAGRLLDALEVATGGITKSMDIEPWLARAPTSVEAITAFLQGTEYAYRFLAGGRAHFERAVHLDSEFIAPRVWLVSGLVGERDTAAARAQVDVLRSLESQATPFEQAMIGWADAVFRGDWEAKVRHLRVALGYSPRNNILLYNLGATLEAMGRVREAVIPIREAVESRWRFPPLYTLWGVVAIHTGELEGLRETLESARSITPQSPYLEGLLEALALFDGDADATERSGAAFRAQVGQAGMAGARAEMVPIYRSLAQRAREQGETHRAVLLLQRAVDAEPELPAPRLELARALAEAGNRMGAETHYRSARRGEIDAPAMLYLAGEVAALLGRHEDARRYLTRYLELAPDGPEAVRARERLRSLVVSPGGP